MVLYTELIATDNCVSPRKDSVVDVCGDVSTKLCDHFHNSLFREDLLLRIGSADHLHMTDTRQLLANRLRGSVTEIAI